MINDALAYHMGNNWNNCIDSIVKSTIWADLGQENIIFWLMTPYNLYLQTDSLFQ
jgi:hypothetical protein